MIKTIKRIVRVFSVTALFLCLSVTPMVSAESSPGVPAENPAAAYVYIAREGDSLSRMVRHSLQLYEQANKLTMEPSKAIYCEAMIAQGLGNIRLEVGQRVEITMQDIQQCISQSRLLSADDLAGWQLYAQQVSFDTSDLQPVAMQVTPDTQNTAPQSGSNQESMSPAEPIAPTEPTAPAAPAAPSATQQPAEPAPPAPIPAKKFTFSNWWYAAAGGLAIAYFLFGDRLAKRRNL